MSSVAACCELMLIVVSYKGKVARIKPERINGDYDNADEEKTRKFFDFVQQIPPDHKLTVTYHENYKAGCEIFQMDDSW